MGNATITLQPFRQNGKCCTYCVMSFFYIIRKCKKNKNKMVVRTQQEIKERFEKSNDLFGTQQGDLIMYMNFESAKLFLKEEYVKEVEEGRQIWEVRTDPKKEILEYLDFAYKKAEGERGLSAGRSMLHFKTWIWLDSEEFYSDIVSDIDNYINYGIPTLNKIAKHYGFSRS